MSALATRIGWERSRASHHVRRMSERGLVILRTSTTDRRSTDVSLADLGRTTLGRASPGHAALVRTMFFGALDDRRTAALAESFELIYEELIRHGTLPRPADHP